MAPEFNAKPLELPLPLKDGQNRKKVNIFHEKL